MPRTGRPPTFDNQKQQTLLQLLAQGLTIKEAARHVGVWTSTVYNKKLQSPAFAAACQQAKSQSLPALLEHVHSAGSRSWRASAWLLERLRPDLFGRRVALGLDPAKPKPPKPLPDHVGDKEMIVEFIERLRLLPEAQAIAKEKLAELEDQQHAWTAARHAYAEEIDRRNRPHDLYPLDSVPFPSHDDDDDPAPEAPVSSPESPASIAEPDSENSDNSSPNQTAQVERPQPEPAIFSVDNGGLSGV
jgi:hypothetical protein